MFLVIFLSSIYCIFAELATIDLTNLPPKPQPIPAMGDTTSPRGDRISIDSQSLRLNDKPWLLRIGEVQFSRIPQEEWADTIAAAREGGLTTIGTYIFWIHHQEEQQTWRWDGQRNLRAFAQAVAAANMTMFVRAGPWAHGECRNGGFPDWLVHTPGIQLRSLQALYMGFVKVLYTQIAEQLRGLYWSNGGPVIGVQVDNEYGGSYEYLAALKQTAIDAGVNVPFFSKTGWPSEPQPFGILLPFFGGYADGFWDRDIKPVDSYNDVFLFKQSADGKYPPLTVETGGGMTLSYHRRIRMHPHDMGALALVAAGSGNNCLGYYIYRGGTHPDGVLSTQEECQITGYPNDLQIKSYDFFAPISQFGDIHPHYHYLRSIHTFLDDYQDVIVSMSTYLPDVKPSGVTDLTTLRWSVRSNGSSGVIFINNYQRNLNMSNTTTPMTDKVDVRFQLKLAMGKGNLLVPSETSAAVKIPPGAYTLWPFNFPIAPGLTLTYATVQPIATIADTTGTIVVLFVLTDGIDAEFAVEASSGVGIVSCPNAVCTLENGVFMVRKIVGDTSVPAATVTFHNAVNTHIAFVVISASTGAGVWKGELAGRKRLFLTPPDMKSLLLLNPAVSSGAFRIRTSADKTSISILPAPSKVVSGSATVPGVPDGLFTKYTVPVPTNSRVSLTATYKLVQEAGPARKVPIGPSDVAEAPDEDGAQTAWQSAAIYHVQLTPNTLDNLSKAGPVRNSLRIRYNGDCARVYINGSLVQDNFFNGDYEFGFMLGVNRFLPEILDQGFDLKILPLSQDAPIYLSGWPTFPPGKSSVVELLGIDVLQTVDVALEGVQ